MVMGDTLAPQGENGPPTYQTLSLNSFQKTHGVFLGRWLDAILKRDGEKAFSFKLNANK